MRKTAEAREPAARERDEVQVADRKARHEAEVERSACEPDKRPPGAPDQSPLKEKGRRTTE